MNKWAILGTIFIIGTLILFFLPPKERPSDEEKPVKRPVTVPTLGPGSGPLPTPTIQNEAGEKVFKIPEPPEIERKLKALSPQARELLEKNNRLNHFKQLALFFPEDQSGQQLLLLTTFLEIKMPKLIDQQRQELIANPEETMLTLGIAMKKMGQQFPAEKQKLLQFMAKLDIPIDEKRELLVTEAKRPLDRNEATTTAQMTPKLVTAVLGNLYFEHGREKNLFPIVRDIALAHSAYPEIQKSVILEYKRFDRPHAKQLWDELGLANK